MNRSSSLRSFSLCILLALPLTAFGLTVELKELKDSRTTGEFFKGLDVELTLKGEEMKKAKAVRTKIASAKDSTGKDLIDTSQNSTDFNKFYGASDSSEQSVTIKLLNPERKAESLKELTGSVELYVPDLDPTSTIALKGFKQHSGKQLDNPTLKGLGLEITLLTSAQQAEQQKKEQEKRVAEMKAQGADPQMIEMAMNMMQAFSGGSDENSVTLLLKDPQSRFMDVEFQSATGEKIDNNGSMSSGDTKVLYFNQPIPDDANVSIRLLTDKALIKAPLQLAALALP